MKLSIRQSGILVASLLECLIASGCKDVGFRELDVAAKNKASVQTAHEVLSQVQQGLHSFYETKHHYPVTTEAHLYDSIRNYITTELDPIHLFRNENGKGYFIAVGSRSERIIYRYPPSIGTGEYTLYWVGPNGVDEDGEGDDLDAFTSLDTARRFERQRLADLIDDRDPTRLIVVRTGTDIFKDSVRLEVLKHDSILYRDSWPLTAYFKERPELTDAERKRLIRTELDHFFSAGSFVKTDSLLDHDWSKWAEIQPKSQEMGEVVRSGEEMFNYYAGDRGSKGIAWLPSKHKFVIVWKS